jgi:hypothetical protein
MTKNVTAERTEKVRKDHTLKRFNGCGEVANLFGFFTKTFYTHQVKFSSLIAESMIGEHF